MNWLQSIPHQIPFRAASTGQKLDAKTIEGSFVCTADDPMPPQIMIVEAMAQLAGGLIFESGRHGFLTGMEGCEIDRAVQPGDVVALTVRLEAEFGGTYRFSGSGSISGLQCLRGRFYLAAPDAQA